MHNIAAGAAERGKEKMPYRLDTQAQDITDSRYNCDDAYDYECTHDYNRLHIYYICNGYRCNTLQDAQRQRKRPTDTIYMICNGCMISL